MIVDTSAFIAILFEEPERPAFVKLMLEAKSVKVAAPNWFETCIVRDSRAKADPRVTTNRLLAELGVDIVPFDAGMAELARDAYRRYGRGNHPARLNFGDCMAYALAKSTAQPLLFKGQDFTRTDITPALT